MLGEIALSRKVEDVKVLEPIGKEIRKTFTEGSFRYGSKMDRIGCNEI